MDDDFDDDGNYCGDNIPLSGFDAKGEPEIRVIEEGQLHIFFNFMPHSHVTDPNDAEYDDFAEQMAAAIGVEVEQEDREVFVVYDASRATIDKISAFISNYHKNKKL